MKTGYVTNANFYVKHMNKCKYNFVCIPIEVLEKIGLKPGDSVEIRTYKDRINIKKDKNE